MDSLALGAVLGLAIGAVPVPLLGLVLASSLRGGTRLTVITSIAPLLSDAVIVAAAVLVHAIMPSRLVAAIGIVGAVVVILHGADALIVSRRRDPVPRSAALRPPAIKANVVNLESPQPWLFWLTAGAPLIFVAQSSGGNQEAGAFIAAFFIGLVVTRVALGQVVASSRKRLPIKLYGRLLIASAVVLVLLGLVLVVRFTTIAFQIA